MCYNLMNIITRVFCTVISLSHGVPGWKVQGKGICGSGNGNRLPSSSSESFGYPESLQVESEERFPSTFTICWRAPAHTVCGYCSGSQTSHGLMTLRRKETCGWDLSGEISVWLGQSLSRYGKSV